MKMSMFQKILNCLPIKKDKIVFNNFNGRGYGCNPKYIAKELLRQGSRYELVWLVSDKKVDLPKGIRPVKIYTKQARIELATAGIIVSNVKNGPYFEKKKRQYYIQTWHGDFALKYIEGETERSLSPEYLAMTKSDSQRIDLVLSGSVSFSIIVKSSFWYNGEILESGLPRNDIFFDKDSFIPQQIRKQLGISQQADIVLYAPTFRDNGSAFPFPDFIAILNMLEKITGKEWVFVVRLHPNDLTRSGEIQFCSKVINGSVLSDMQELEKAADLLITDYSSIMYDFVLQNKPVTLFTPDLDSYRTNCRDLRPLYNELPFVRAVSQLELIEKLPMLFSRIYQEKVEAFFKKEVLSFDDGLAAKRVVERIHQVISNNGEES